MEERELPKAEFYADPVRARSPEWDFGVNWIDGPDWPRWRVSYVVETGELYAQQHMSETILLLGQLETVGEYPYGERPPGAWREFNRAQPVERILAGWADVFPQKLDWVRDRLAADRAKVGPVHKAVPMRSGLEGRPRCAVCGQAVKSVPGGQGTTWVHEQSGTVAAGNPA
jgi:hypothetical protein